MSNRVKHNGEDLATTLKWRPLQKLLLNSFIALCTDRIDWNQRLRCTEKKAVSQFPPSMSSLHMKDDPEIPQAFAHVQGSLSVGLETENQQTKPNF